MKMIDFDHFMKQLSQKVGGDLEDFGFGDVGLNVKINESMYVTFSPDEQGYQSSMGTWVAGVYDDAKHIHNNMHRTLIPNTCRDINRLATWIKGVQASLMGELTPENKSQRTPVSDHKQSKWLD